MILSRPHRFTCYIHTGARDSPPLELGDDVRLRSQRKFRGLRRSRQHLLNLQFENKRGNRSSFKGIKRPYRLVSCFNKMLLYNEML